ncbi:MAG: hypothetical protein HY929_04270 [Euryarchaeota archaeon]|nr:hypothetical protein [Euryarchaeota archaeon]
MSILLGMENKAERKIHSLEFLKNLEKKLDQLANENLLLRKENLALKEENAALEEENVALKIEIKELKRRG